MSDSYTNVERMVIVGGGFSGTVLAANMLRRALRPLHIHLVERANELGRGVAYAAHAFPYQLNVPANRLSADSADPPSFLRFARRTLPDADGEDFLPRGLYGDYLQDFLAQAEAGAAPHVKLTRVTGEVVGIGEGEAEGPLSAQFADRAPIGADRIILALGNPPPSRLPCVEAVHAHPAYYEDPWRAPDHLRGSDQVMIVGNGLTMADVALALSRHAGRVPRVITVSRRGLTPHAQTTFRPTALRGDGAALLERATSIRAVMSIARLLARDVAHLGGDWREAVTFLRGLAPAIWQRLPVHERARFLRHAQAHWDTHRHRLPPETEAHVRRLQASGRLEVHAGRIEQVAAVGHRLQVTWRPRGSASVATTLVDALVNATGPDYALTRSRDALLKSLHGGGRVSADDLNLGIRTSEEGACLAADGSPSNRLYYIGPMLRATHWEATAATELRNHAERLARHLSA